MSQTLSQIAPQVRILLNDVDQPYAIDTQFRLYRAIVRNAQIMGEDARASETWITAAITATPNSLADVTFPAITNSSYQAIMEIRDPINGRPLWRLAPEEINWLRRGVVATTTGQGDPIAYCLWEDAANVMTLRWDRVPSRTISYDVKRRAVVANSFIDSATLDFNAPMLRGIECATAAELYRSMTSEMRTKLSLPAGGREAKELLDSWDEVKKTAVIRERHRRDNLQGRAYGAGFVVS